MNQASSLMDAFRLDGRVAAITGGARGIGYATAKLFTAAGARVMLLDVDEIAAKDAAARLGPTASAMRLDVTSEVEVTRAFDAVVASQGHIDVLVNNAGMALRRATTELSLSEWNRVVDVNMTGVFLCARAAATHMLRSGGGAMVNTASIMGLSGGGLYPNISYQATKGAVVNMTRALAVEWADRGVRVNAVAPTWVDTEFIGPLKSDAVLMDRIRQMTPLRRLAEATEVANAILFLASPASAMVTGHVLAVDGGFLAQ